MKEDFRNAATKIQLFAEKATVMSYTLTEASITESSGGVEIRKKTFKPADLQRGILQALVQAKIPHEEICRNDNEIVFAVPRDKKEAASAVVSDYLSGGSLLALRQSSTFEAANSTFAEVRNAFLKPFSPVRREVAQALQRMSRG